MLRGTKESAVIYLFSFRMEDFKARYRAQVDKVTEAVFTSKNGLLSLSIKTTNLALPPLLRFSREVSFSEAIRWQYGSQSVGKTFL